MRMRENLMYVFSSEVHIMGHQGDPQTSRPRVEKMRQRSTSSLRKAKPMAGRKPKGNQRAAIAGSKEVIAELEGNKSGADKYGSQERNYRSNYRGRSNHGTPRSGGESKMSAQYSGYANRPLWPMDGKIKQQSVDLHHLESGAVLTTPYGRDPYRVNKVEALILEYPQVNWGTFTNNTGAGDPSAAQCGARLTAIYAEITDVINFNGRFIPQQVLTSAGDFAKYLNNYTECFSICFSILSVMKCLDLNTSFRAFGPGLSGQGNLDRVALAWRRLQKVPIPPKVVEHISQLVGVFYSDVEDFAFVTHVNNAATITNVTDFTSASAVGTLITRAETLLVSLETTTLEAAQIGQTFGVVYGTPAPLPEPEPHTQADQFDLHFTRGINYLSGTNTACPIITGPGNVGGVFPVLQRKGADNDTLFSLLRPQLYSFSGVPSSASTDLSGLLTNVTGTADFSRYYGPNVATNNTIISDSSFAALNYGDGSFFEVQWWASLVQSAGINGIWQHDSRSYDRWDEYYPTVQNIGSNTVKKLDTMFLTDLSIRDLR